MEPLLGTIIMFAGNFAPRGWAFCQGQLLPISQNTALFSLLGTTYGGDGRTTFGLPDLRGRVPLGEGAGPGLTPRTLGQKGGAESVTLTTAQMPSHAHALQANREDQTSKDPLNNYLSKIEIYTNAAPDTALGTQSITTTGGSQPHENMQPFLGINFIIALEGVFPSRS